LRYQRNTWLIDGDGNCAGDSRHGARSANDYENFVEKVLASRIPESISHCLERLLALVRKKSYYCSRNCWLAFVNSNVSKRAAARLEGDPPS
jgi:hypothetical protein